ncbi:MAG: hypothetical protein ACTSU5_02070 [Promethearchaeota archaeon]
MEQINFRVDAGLRDVIRQIAEFKHLSVAEFAKRATMAAIREERVEIAFELVARGKITRKRAWLLSGLSYPEFLVEWSKRGAEEKVPEDLVDSELAVLGKVDLKSIIRSK